MKLTTRLVHGAVFCAALIGLTSFGATPTAVWQGNGLTDGNVQNGMTLRLNGNTSAGGVVTIGSSSVYIETGMTSSSPHAGTEATVVMTWENVKPSVYGAVATFTTASQAHAVGAESFGYSTAVSNQLYWIKDNYYSGWNPPSYPNDLASHKVAFACASPTSGTGSGGYNGSAIAVDGEIAAESSSITATGNCITRIDLGGYTDRTRSENYQTGARITRIAVYNSALSTADLRTVTEEDPEPEEDDIWGNVGNETDGGIATKADNGNYGSTWTLNFANTTNICTTGIGNDGVVRIKQIKIARRNSDGNTPPTSLQLAQGTVSAVSTNRAIVADGIAAYTTGKGILSGSTRDAYVFTYDATAEFDTAKPITLTFDVNTVGLGVMQPANPLFQTGNHSPMIEITGDYTSRIVGPVITKDSVNHTWVVDTTYGAYEFTDDDINDLKATKWAVTLKSRSELGVTIDFGNQTSQQLSHFVFESGVHYLTWKGNAQNINFNKTGTAEDPSILVKRGAVLNFTAKDITGWLGAATDKKGNVIRVNEGGLVNLLQDGENTHYYQGRYYLDPGATLTATYSGDTFRLNGGAVEGSEQLYVPNTTNGAPVATLFAANGLRLAKDDTAGLGVFVGTNATLEVDADISSDGAQPLTKWGTGTLAIMGALTNYTGALTVNAGALKLPQETTLGGSLTLAANTVLDIAYDGLPSKGTAIFTATGGIVTNDAVIVRVNGDACVYAVEDNAIVFDHIVVVVPAKSFTYEPKVNASPSGWITSFGGETFTAAGQFRAGPDGECVSVVTADPTKQYPWYNLGGKSNYTMALYADISHVSYDKTGRYLVELGGKGNGINQGLLMTKDGNIQLFQANLTTVEYTLTTTNPPAAGYHLFVWTQSTADGGALYVDGERVGTIPEMTSATSKGFQLGSMHGGAWNGNYAQGIGMAVAGVYGWGQVLSPAQVARLAEDYPAVTGGITVKSVPQSISGTLNLVYGNTITSGVYNCSIAVAYGATIDIKYDGVVEEGAEILSAKSISADAVTFTINGQPLPPELDMDASGGRLVIGKQKVTKLLNPLAVKEGDDLKVSCNEEAEAGSAAKAYDGNLSTYFAPGSAANALGVSWTGIEFTNGVIVTRIAYVSNKERRVIGGAFQGANKADFSDATNMYVVAEYTNGGVDVTLDEAKGPYKYLRFIGMYGGEVKEIAYYGLADSGAHAPTEAPTVEATSSNGVARITVTADETIPQLFVVQRAMRNFCDPDGSDYETCVTLAPQLGETMTWTDRKPTGYAMYRARGFNANGSSEWTYFEIEPEKLINGPTAPSFKGDKPGFYDETASVEITYGDPNATIYYTTDGSTPTTNSTPYTGAITLVDVCESMTNDLVNIRPNPKEVTDSGYKWIQPTADQPNVNVIRARAFLPDGSASSNDVAGTWMVGPTANAHKLRVISIQTDRDNYFSDPTGIMVPGDVYNQKGWPGGTVGSPNANYFQHGDDWERPAQIEIFDTDRSEMLSAPMGTRIRGNWSRAAAKKSLTCYFRKEYGVKNAKIKLFNDEKKMKFKRFNLRNGGNDWYKFGYRDAIGQSMFRGYVSTGTQGFEPGVLYINGEYWGLYNLRHCYSKHHFEEWNGGVGDDIDYVKMSPDDGNHFEVQEGDLCAMWNIMQYMITCTADDVMDDDEYAYVSSQIDITDMIDYYIINAFLGNNDWLSNGNNMGYWRNRHGDDQKWHFTVYDCDSAMSFGGDSYGTDHIDAALKINDENDAGTKMAPGFFKRCFKNEGFRKRFANRYADLLNTALTAERATNVVAEVAATVSHELPRNIDRWLNIGSGANWSNELARVNKFFYRRQEKVFGHILSHCNGGALASITLTNSVGNGTVKLNTIESGKEFELPFTGTYFANIPVTLTATPESGSEFAGWKIGDEVISTEPTMTLTPTNGVTIQAVFQAGGANPQQALRLVEVYGSTNKEIDPEKNTNEYIIITNTTDTAIDLKGLRLTSEKVGKSPSVDVTLAAGTIAPKGSYKFKQFDWTVSEWEKITNGAITMKLYDSDGAEIQVGNTTFTGDADGAGASMLADNLLNPCDAWHVGPIHDVPPTPPPVTNIITGEITTATTYTESAYTISNATLKAVLTFKNPDGVTLTLADKSTGSSAGKIVTTGPLTLGGDGELSLTGDTALMDVGGLTIHGGTLNLTASHKKKIRAVVMKGNYYQDGGTVNLNVTGTAKDKNALGFVWEDQTNAVYTATLEGKAVFHATMTSPKKSDAFRSENSGVTVTLGGDAVVTGDFSGVAGELIETDADITIKGGAQVTVTSTATDGKILEAAGKITVKKATIDITATGADTEAFSAGDTISIENKSAVLRIKSTDDCFNAQTNILVSAGIVYGHSISNDVFDSNGQMTISGGTIVAYTLAEGHEAFDTECYPDNGLDHTFTITGGTVIGLGGTNASWPTNCVFKQNTYTNMSCAAAEWNEKYLVAKGSTEEMDVTATALLPKIDDAFIMLVSEPGLTGEPTASEEEPTGTQVAEGVPLWIEQVAKTFQENLRFYEIYGSTLDGGDTNEYVVVTNVSNSATVNLEGVVVNLWKLGDWEKYQKEPKSKYESKCKFTIPAGLSIGPGASITLKQDDYSTAGWSKITNGDLKIILTDSLGKTIQIGQTSFSLYPQCDGGGASLIAKTFGVTIESTKADWKPSFWMPTLFLIK